MHRARPIVTESIDELKALLKQETHRLKHQRLHALYLFASDPALTRQDVAKLLGLHRETVGRWMTQYTDGGLTALLAIYVAAGRTACLSEPVSADLERKLQEAHGFASHEAMRIWLVQTHQVTIKPKTLEAFVRRRFGARPKVARPSDLKKTLTQ
jgi:transposase